MRAAVQQQSLVVEIKPDSFVLLSQEQEIHRSMTCAQHTAGRRNECHYLGL